MVVLRFLAHGAGKGKTENPCPETAYRHHPGHPQRSSQVLLAFLSLQKLQSLVDVAQAEQPKTGLI
jgi:hypothetical protein